MEKNLLCEKISPQDRLSCGEIFHMTNRQLEKSLHMVDMEIYGVKSVMTCGEISSHERCGDKSVLSQFLLFCREICFIAIYAVLLRKIFCRDLRAFVWSYASSSNPVTQCLGDWVVVSN